jgi:hypothetical protein
MGYFLSTTAFASGILPVDPSVIKHVHFEDLHLSIETAGYQNIDVIKGQINQT